MIKHIVMWRVKDGAEGASKMENAVEIKTRLEGLMGVVPGVVSLEVGINELAGETSADVVLVSEFASMEELDAYQTHPLHLEVVAFVKKVATERRAVDYSV
ncbi:MAG: hypothetical protein PWQ57_77 [Desulfovibrionales bacterium]|jgi:hypothetical protein|nr:hypothetical protein [Desulfovibrionales bacterium]